MGCGIASEPLASVEQQTQWQFIQNYAFQSRSSPLQTLYTIHFPYQLYQSYISESEYNGAAFLYQDVSTHQSRLQNALLMDSLQQIIIANAKAGVYCADVEVIGHVVTLINKYKLAILTFDQFMRLHIALSFGERVKNQSQFSRFAPLFVAADAIYQGPKSAVDLDTTFKVLVKIFKNYVNQKLISSAFARHNSGLGLAEFCKLLHHYDAASKQSQQKGFFGDDSSQHSQLIEDGEQEEEEDESEPEQVAPRVAVPLVNQLINKPKKEEKEDSYENCYSDSNSELPNKTVVAPKPQLPQIVLGIPNTIPDQQKDIQQQNNHNLTLEELQNTSKTSPVMKLTALQYPPENYKNYLSIQDVQDIKDVYDDEKNQSTNSMPVSTFRDIIKLNSGNDGPYFNDEITINWLFKLLNVSDGDKINFTEFTRLHICLIIARQIQYDQLQNSEIKDLGQIIVYLMKFSPLFVVMDDQFLGVYNYRVTRQAFIQLFSYLFGQDIDYQFLTTDLDLDIIQFSREANNYIEQLRREYGFQKDY